MIPYHKPFNTGNEDKYLKEVIKSESFSGSGGFIAKAQELLKTITGCKNVLLTHSCTGALEMCAILANVQPGDEIIMPSFTFVSTASAFALRGAIPVFVDICADTQNINPDIIEKAITPKTKAIVVVHYAGISCDMERISNIAKKHNLLLIEDAAQCIGAYKNNKHLGTFSDLATLSFHETKSIHCGHGGALLINNEKFLDKAEIIWEKGTNRQKFLKGQIDKYSWVDIGSSFQLSQLNAAFLLDQLEHLDSCKSERKQIFYTYHKALEKYEDKGLIARPIFNNDDNHNSYIYYIIMNTPEDRDNFISYMKDNEVQCSFHYVPLHSSTAGIKYCRAHGELPNTLRAGNCLVRLPLWNGMKKEDVECVIDNIEKFFA